jgi:hypothetical protein
MAHILRTRRLLAHDLRIADVTCCGATAPTWLSLLRFGCSGPVGEEIAEV